jgi:hypothetical protein
MLVLAACRLRADGPPPSDQDGDEVSLAKLTARGSTVLVFYRGHW